MCLMWIIWRDMNKQASMELETRTLVQLYPILASTAVPL